MGPPLTTMAGMLRRAAAMSIPGVILSHSVTSTIASYECPLTMHSMESQMSSLLARG